LSPPFGSKNGRAVVREETPSVGHNIWIKEIRAPFLLLPVVLVPVGLAMSWDRGSFNPLTALLTLVGVFCVHASVNVLNDYFDFRSGLDIATTPTPFSGGSRVLPAKELTPTNVLYGGLLFLGLGAGIGSYLIYETGLSPILVVILSLAVISAVGYTTVISRLGLGELAAGLNFGPLLFIGTYYVQTGTVALQPIFVGTTLGILVAGILYINEFPDTAADEKTGRRHLVIRWGKRKAASRFRILIASAYAVIVVGVVGGIVTPIALISLIALPKAWSGTRVLTQNYDKTMELIPGMASTVMATLLTGVLLFIAYLALHFV
jgi:1,4-dihydroxy-2-naphthoate octaprenyltransferase